MVNVRVHRDGWDMLFIKCIYLFGNGRCIIGSQHNAMYILGEKFLYG